MTSPLASAPATASAFPVRALSLAQRLLLCVLLAVGLFDLLAAAWVLVSTFAGAYSSRPPDLAVGLGVLALVLWGLFQLMSTLARATLSVEPGRLVLERRGERVEIPLASVAAVRAWRVPLPGAGLTLRMQSGRAFAYGLQVADPLPLLEAIGREHAGAAGEARHPLVAFAHARATSLFQRRWQWVLKFLVFPLLPGTVLFQLNQRITYGGPFAQYQMYGWGPYLASFAIYVAYATAALVLLASVFRGAAEGVAYGAAWLSPPHARGVRRVVEVACALLYYVGLPALLAARILL
jgi:hypothetical protein